jgi:hypothetical protein
MGVSSLLPAIVPRESMILTVESCAQLSLNNRRHISRWTHCGCYQCEAVFPGQHITNWTDVGQTAFCPRCDCDSVLANVTDRKFLHDARLYWFGLGKQQMKS